MTIYRVHQDANYLVFEIPGSEVANKLGREHPFHIKRAPLPYSQVWTSPLHIQFKSDRSTVNSVIPDLSARNGRLFLSQKAKAILADTLTPYGEFLPVTYDGGEGYIFNPLCVAESLGLLDDNLTSYDENGNLENFSFIENGVSEAGLFRAEIDTFQGIFCNEACKNLIQTSDLKGVYFHLDVSDTVGETSAYKH